MTYASTIIAALGGDQRTGMCRCPAHEDQNPSLHVSDGRKSVVFFCHAGCSQPAVLDALKREGHWPTGRERVRLRPSPDNRTTGTEQIARELLDAAEESDECPTAYLRRRGIERSPLTLKLLSSSAMRLITGKMLPGMTASITDKDGRKIGAHVTYLTRDAKKNAVGRGGKVRRIYGNVAGGLVVLEAADPDKPYVIAEGIETALSAMQITDFPGAAALSATNMSKIDPPKCSEVIIAADADDPGMKAAEQLAGRLAAAGRKVRIAVPATLGNDWNDELWADGDPGDLKRKLVEAPLYQVPADDDDAAFLAAVKPWYMPVNGAELLGELVSVFNRHMDLPTGAADALALWVVHAYAHDAAQHSPILFISSPTKRCGKTNLLSVLQLLVPKPLPASNVTPATVFRSIGRWKPTLLIDEADTFISDDSVLRGVLNSGHKRSQAYVLRCVGEDLIPTQFPTWCPKAFAAIGRLPSTLEDRSIIVELRRKLKTVRVERVPARDDAYDDLRRKMARWAADNFARLEQANPEAAEELSDRARDNWAPLLAIAEAAGGGWFDRASAAARLLSARDDDEGEAEMLLYDLRAIFAREDADALHTETLIEALVELEARPWADFRRGQPITAHALARLLKPFNVFPRKIRLDGVQVKRSGYEREKLKPVWRRYLDGDSTTNQTGQSGQRKQKQRLRVGRNRAAHKGRGRLDRLQVVDK